MQVTVTYDPNFFRIIIATVEDLYDQHIIAFLAMCVVAMVVSYHLWSIGVEFCKFAWVGVRTCFRITVALMQILLVVYIFAYGLQSSQLDVPWAAHLLSGMAFYVDHFVTCSSQLFVT